MLLELSGLLICESNTKAPSIEFLRDRGLSERSGSVASFAGLSKTTIDGAKVWVRLS